MRDLRSQLMGAANAWCAVHEAPLSRLGKAVASDAAFFDRVEGRAVLPCTVATLEKFARFLADPVNWPDGVVAEEARALAHVTGVTAPSSDVATVDAGQKDSQEAA